MRISALLLFLFTVIFPAYVHASRAKVVLHDGRIVYGKVVEENDVSVTIVPDGTNATNKFNNRETKEFSYIDYRVVKNYFVWGATLGTPSGLNLILGYHFAPFGAQLSGSYLYFSSTNIMAGAQLNFIWKFYENDNFYHGISLITGYSRTIGATNTSDWLYGGLTYNLNWGLFYLDVGLSAGTGSYTTPQLSAQIGILCRFNREKVAE